MDWSWLTILPTPKATWNHLITYLSWSYSSGWAPYVVVRSKSFACKAAYINKNIEKGKSRMFFTFKQEEHEALVTVQEKIVSAALPVLTCNKRQWALVADTCNKKIGFVLTEKQPDETKRQLPFGSERGAFQSESMTHHNWSAGL